ncbi:MAG: hypothetical protein EAZ08_01560 [Cytophagales bacterium]|nr:MAG: hypothetical protein EAZ08_01560 [Cytophagales bacterium]
MKNISRWVAFIALFCLPFAARSQSVLSQGNFYKVAVPKHGIYKIDLSTLVAMGIPASGLDPQTIQIFGNGGGILPQANSAFRNTDLVENAIFISGENDGKFDENDYILFYAEGADRFIPDFAQQIFRREENFYDENNYYFLTFGQKKGKRIASRANGTQSTTTINSFDDYAFHQTAKRDRFSIIESGRVWFGEKFDFNTEQSFNFDMAGISPSSSLRISSSLMANSPVRTNFSISLNNTEIGVQNMTSVPQGIYAVRGTIAENLFSAANISTNALNIKIKYNKNGETSSYGHLLGLGIHANRKLQLYGKQTRFRSFQSARLQNVEFQIESNNNDLTIWDISNPLNPIKQEFAQNGNNANFKVNTNNLLKEFVLFQGSDFDKPIFIEKIKNQNLQALETPNLLIITPEVFLTEANRLADFRRKNDKLKVQVATIPQIYNEYSSGKQDISAIRDFIRALYNKQANSKDLKYVLLFGDASYDYKDYLPDNTNFVPTYQSRESLHPLFSYASDDFFGFLEDREGEWQETEAGNHSLDIGVGRLPAKSDREAKIMVDKLIHYASVSSLGDWRKQVVFVADDGDGNDYQLQAEKHAEKLEKNDGVYNIEKLYIDAYPKELTANGKKSPALRQEINQTIQDGTLLMNYIGHGAITGWASESILDITQVSSWQNLDRLPLLVTATCEFGRFDRPRQTAGAEYAMINPNGGAIALVTTTRPVFSDANYIINDAFYDIAFTTLNGEMPRLGDIQRITKNNSLRDVNNRNFSLLGDPSMRLAYPQEDIVITNIKNTQSQSIEILRALEKVTISGEVVANRSTDTNFNGTLFINIFDKPSTFKTFGDEAPQMTFNQKVHSLFKGTASVKNGKFEFSFVVPKDIDYAVGSGKISFYAQDNQRNLDASGYKSDISIGATTTNIVADNQAPQMGVFMDNESFISGGTVKPNTTLIVKLSDENGINISGAGIGHDITATLNGKQIFVLNRFYKSEKDDFRKGEVRFDFQNLPDGKYSLVVKAWDTHNNSTIQTIEFIVEKESFTLSNVKNFPNPFTDEISFSFTHNRIGEDLDIRIEIYNTVGALVKTIERYDYNARSEVESIIWDGLGENRSRVASGIYVYRMIVNATISGASQEYRGKILAW